MKNYSRWLAGFLFLLFFCISFWNQKTIVIKYNDYYYPVLTYVNNSRNLMQSIGKDFLIWKMDFHQIDDRLYDGKIIEVDAFWFSP